MKMQISLQGRVAVVTGAASGIGLAVATAMAEAGASVVLSDLRQDAAEAQAQALRQRGLDVMAVAADASDEGEIDRLFTRAEAQYGHVDIVVNNAGMQHVAPIEDFPSDVFRKMVDLMLTGPFLSIKRALPGMKARGYGRILNMASVNGLIGFAGKAAYNAAKHGLIGLTKVAAFEAAEHGVTVNALCPGYVDTPLVRNQLADLARTRNVPVEQVLEDVIYPLVPQKRLLSPEEVAHYAVFLASDLAASVTGQAVVIDGGYVAQ